MIAPVGLASRVGATAVVCGGKPVWLPSAMASAEPVSEAEAAGADAAGVDAMGVDTASVGVGRVETLSPEGAGGGLIDATGAGIGVAGGSGAS